MDDEMIERCVLVAKAKRCELQHMPLERCYNEITIAIIKAMHEPTDKMIDAAMWNGVTGQIVGEALTKECWQDMIDAVIND